MDKIVKDNSFIPYGILKISKSNNFRLVAIIILFSILYLALYLFADPSTQSLIAHDEGLYARRARLLEQSSNWFIPPFDEAHHKTLGSYWLIALAIKFFGYSELSIRFPSFISSFICVVLLYLITIELVNKKAAYISVLSLISMPLWINYSKYASPDMAFVTCTLIMIYSLIKAFTPSDPNKYIYLFLASFSISIGFFIRSYMILIPSISISPYVFTKLKSEKLESYLILITGFIVGMIPSLINLYFAYKVHSINGVTSLFDFARKQAIGSGLIKNIYLIPINIVYLTFPIGLLVILLFIYTKPKNKIRVPLIVYIYPLISSIILLSMSKSYAHYFLFLLPSLAIISSVYLESFSYKFAYSFRSIKYVLLTVFTFLIAILTYSAFLDKYQFLNLSIIQKKSAIFISIILILSYVFSINNILFRSYKDKLIKLLLLITVPQIVSINILYNLGIMGNPNTGLKNFVFEKSFMDISSRNDIYLLKLNTKTNTLLSYYLPSSKKIDSLKLLPNNSYFMTSDSFLVSELKISREFKLLSSLENNYLFTNTLYEND